MKILEKYISKSMPMLRKRLSKVVTNFTDRDDIIQEACVAILKAQPNITEQELPKYFTRVLFSKVAAYKNAQDDVTVLAGFVNQEADLVRDPVKELMRQENQAIVTDLIQRHGGSAEMQEALDLIYREGCSPSQAADIVGANRAAVYMASSRFRKHVFGLYEGMRV